MQTKITYIHILQSLAIALKKSKLYKNERVGKNATIIQKFTTMTDIFPAEPYK